ncbi:MAG: gamma-glutamyl-gamma-aminobutyrate hydrolase family protein [Nitrospirales bacterium]|nr:gamma-glutamyl-gamma-aminobutyrate hydrolase family protein [Nitrospirales bacterium]
MKPIIGVTPDFNAGDRKDMGGKEPTYFLRARYLEAIEAAGGLPLVLPLVNDALKLRLLLEKVDGLLVTGSGSDLAPELYGERQRFKFRRMSRQRSSLELGIAKLAYRSGGPTLGICGGMQSMNVALGGTLIQDISSQIPTSISHQPSFPATKPAHIIDVMPQTLMRRIAGRATLEVNSSHHQSVKKLPRQLIISALSPDGVIEAIESCSHPFYLGVQWHPECLYSKDPIQKRLFQALVKASKKVAP